MISYFVIFERFCQFFNKNDVPALFCRYLRKVAIISNFMVTESKAFDSNNTFMKNNHVYELTDMGEILY